jgi:amino acid/peptide:H+ symporter
VSTGPARAGHDDRRNHFPTAKGLPMGENKVETSTQPQAKGHPTALWFFFGGEFAERSSYYGSRAILPLYLTSVLAFSDKDGASIYYWYKMAAYFLPLLGGIVADRWLGRYWTIVGFSIPFVIGQFLLGIPSPFWCMVALFLLLAPGTGVIKPNISSLLGETYDQQRPGQDSLRITGFQYFYFAINIGALISMFAMPILRDKYGYSTAFQLPAWLMIAALAIFAAGKPFYAKESTIGREKTPEQRQEQSATLGLFCVIVLSFAAWFAFDFRTNVLAFAANMGVNIPTTAYLGGIAVFAMAVVMLAARVYRMFSPEMRSTLSRLFGVFGLIVLWWVAYEHNDSIWVYFARDYMSHAEMAFTVPDWLPGWLGGGTRYEPKADAYQFINSLFVLIFIPVFNIFFKMVDPQMKTFTAVRRVLIGFFVTSLASGVMMYAAYRTQGGTVLVSAWWMVIAYIVLTAGEVLLYGTMLDLSYAAAPKSMKGFITACFLLTNTLGNFINSYLTRLYGGSLKDAVEDRGPLGTVQFFGMSMAIVVVAGVAFYFVGKRFERGSAAAGVA